MNSENLPDNIIFFKRTVLAVFEGIFDKAVDGLINQRKSSSRVVVVKEEREVNWRKHFYYKPLAILLIVNSVERKFLFLFSFSYKFNFRVEILSRKIILLFSFFIKH